MPDASPKPFELREFVPYLTNRVGTLMELAFTPQLKQAGLTLDMWRVLMVLHFNGPHTLVELSRITGVKTPTLSRLVGRMIDKGLLSRRRSQTDARTVQVRLRRKGEDLFRKMWPDAAAAEELVIAPFSGQDLELFKSMMRQIEIMLVRHLTGAPKTQGGAQADPQADPQADAKQDDQNHSPATTG